MIARRCLTFVWVWLTLAHVHAQDTATNSKRAAALFDEARVALERHDFGAACSKLEESQRLDAQLGTLLHLAHCYDKQGQPVRAYRAFRAAAEVAAQRHDARQTLAQTRASSLESRVSLLDLQVTGATRSLRVTLDGVPIDTAPSAQPLAIEPGEHVLRASEPSKQSWQQTFTIGVPARIGISVPLLAANEQLVEPEPARATHVTQPAPSVPPVREQSLPSMRLAGYIALGVGLAGLGAGSVFGLLRNGQVSELEKTCDFERGRCVIAHGDLAARERIERHRDRAEGFASAANVAFLVGGVALVGGLVLVLTAPSSPKRDTPSVRLELTPGGLTLTAHSAAF